MREVTRADFLAYEIIRQSGCTNMFNIVNVIMLSANLVMKDHDNGLSKSTCIEIMKKYADLKNKWPEVMDEAMEPARKLWDEVGLIG